MGKIFISSKAKKEGVCMNWKFWEKKKKTVIVPPEPENPKQKKDYFQSLVSKFMPSSIRKCKRRQRGARKGLSRRDWERENGKKWVCV
jgi:hypothetical protein